MTRDYKKTRIAKHMFKYGFVAFGGSIASALIDLIMFRDNLGGFLTLSGMLLIASIVCFIVCFINLR